MHNITREALWWFFSTEKVLMCEAEDVKCIRGWKWSKGFNFPSSHLDV